VTVDYYQRPDGVELQLNLLSPASGLLLAGARALLPQSALGSLQAAPPHLDVAAGALAVLDPAQDAAQSLDVKLWPDHGESSTYADGELIVLHARVAAACHLYLVHADSDGSVQLLYPNPWHDASGVAAGTVDVPAEGDSFQFRAIRPYGAEVIVALATADPLESLEGRGGDGFAALGDGSAALRRVVAEYLAVPPARRGMSRAVYTTAGAIREEP
jgi:hypothetical protein